MKYDYILGIDTGTTQTGICLVDASTYKPVSHDKVSNAIVLDIIAQQQPEKTIVVFERFAPQGQMGKTTLDSIVWYGKFVRECETHSLDYAEIYRREVKKHLLGKFDRSNGTADAQINAALVNRFAPDVRNNGKGTNDSPGWFYGFHSSDERAAYAVCVTWLDKNRKG